MVRLPNGFALIQQFLLLESRPKIWFGKQQRRWEWVDQRLMLERERERCLKFERCSECLGGLLLWQPHLQLTPLPKYLISFYAWITFHSFQPLILTLQSNNVQNKIQGKRCQKSCMFLYHWRISEIQWKLAFGQPLINCPHPRSYCGDIIVSPQLLPASAASSFLSSLKKGRKGEGSP